MGPRKEVINPMTNMARMIANRPMGTTRIKVKQIGYGSPRKEVANPMGQHGRNDSQ